MDQALRYAADGFAVFPVYEPSEYPYGHPLRCTCNKPLCKGKHPRTSNGCLDATTDKATIKGWWTKWPNASIGMATGKKNELAVVDLDGPEGLQSGNSLKLSSTITSLTGAGRQLFYADPEEKLKNSVKKLAPGVDTRGAGGFVVVPPSLHPNGKRYCWAGSPISRGLLPPLPIQFIEQKSTLPGLIKRNEAGWIAEAIKELQNGHVANTLVKVLGKFIHHGFNEEDTYTLFYPHALVGGKPYAGLRGKIAEIFARYPAAQDISGVSKSESIDEFLQDIQKPEWLCEPFIARKSIGFVAGLPETLKTWLCIDLAVECARKRGLWLGLFPVTTCRVLFIDQERWKGETQRRFSSVLAAKAIPHLELKDRLSLKSGTTIRLNLDTSYQAFRTELLEMQPDLVIVDSFVAFHTVPENDKAEVQKVLERVKQLRTEIGCSFLFIHHENKNAYPNGEPQGEPNMSTLSGSTGIPAAAEMCLIVRKVEEHTSMVWHVKSTLARKVKPFYASVLDTAGGISVRGLND